MWYIKNIEWAVTHYLAFLANNFLCAGEKDNLEPWNWLKFYHFANLRSFDLFKTYAVPQWNDFPCRTIYTFSCKTLDFLVHLKYCD